LTEFLETALLLPAAVYSFLLAVVVVYWLVVLLGALGIDFLDGGEGELGPAGFLAALGLGGVPVSVVLSLIIAIAWFGSFAGTALLEAAGTGGPVRFVAGGVVLAVATVVAYLVTYLLVLPLRRLFPDLRPASRGDFVGSFCVVRTSTVDHSHGQAEVTASDGSSAIIQVRQTGDDELRAGETALIFDYDPEGEFFWVTAARTELEPGS
jgi:hypothetical protein